MTLGVMSNRQPTAMYLFLRRWPLEEQGHTKWPMVLARRTKMGCVVLSLRRVAGKDPPVCRLSSVSATPVNNMRSCHCVGDRERIEFPRILRSGLRRHRIRSEVGSESTIVG